MIAGFLEALASQWDGPALQQPLTIVKAAGSTGAARKVNFLVFENLSSSPRFLVKLVRDSAHQQKLQDEFEKLQSIYAFASLRPYVGRPVALLEQQGQLAMVETCLPGIALENLLLRGLRRRPAEIASDLEQTCRWLQVFLNETRQGMYSFRGVIEIEERLTSLPAPLSEKLTGQLFARADRLAGLQIPLAARHGDFWPGNLMMSGSKIGIIDWETLTLQGWPLDDLFLFVLKYALRFYDGVFTDQSAEVSFRKAFSEKGPITQPLSTLIREVLRTLGMPPDLAGFFLVFFLLDMASNRSQIGRIGQPEPLWRNLLAQVHSLDDFVI